MEDFARYHQAQTNLKAQAKRRIARNQANRQPAPKYPKQ